MNRKKLFLIIGCILIFVLLIIVVQIWKNEKSYEMIDIEDSQDEVLSEIQSTEQYIKETDEWMSKQLNGGAENDVGFAHPSKKDQGGDPKKELVQYFITGLTLNNQDIFMSCFNPETISKDLFKINISDKNEVISDMIKQLTRNGIKEVKYKENKGFMKDSNEIALTIIYEDGKEAKININIESLSDMHTEKGEAHTTYYIKDSVWDIIEQIKTALQ